MERRVLANDLMARFSHLIEHITCIELQGMGNECFFIRISGNPLRADESAVCMINRHLLLCQTSIGGWNLAPAGTNPSRQRCSAATLRVRRDERRKGATTFPWVKSSLTEHYEWECGQKPLFHL